MQSQHCSERERERRERDVMRWIELSWASCQIWPFIVLLFLLFFWLCGIKVEFMLRHGTVQEFQTGLCTTEHTHTHTQTHTLLFSSCASNIWESARLACLSACVCVFVREKEHVAAVCKVATLHSSSNNTTTTTTRAAGRDTIENLRQSLFLAQHTTYHYHP